MEGNINVNLKEGSFSITGSEEFTERNKKELEDFIKNNFNLSLNESNVSYPIKAEMGIDKSIPQNIIDDKYIQKGIYAIDSEDGSIAILKKIPGKNNAEKTKNIALIVLYAKGQNEKIQGSEIRKLCEKQKCYDLKNFAAIFKRDISNFIMKGKGQSWTLELSIPGRDNAIELLESMCNDD